MKRNSLTHFYTCVALPMDGSDEYAARTSRTCPPIVRLLGWLFLGQVATLSACMKPSAIWIEPGATTRELVFRVVRSRQDTRPVASIDLITVRTCHGQPGPQVVLWEARGDVPKGASAPTKLTYGVAPAGFHNTGAPKALAGNCLEGVISGSGVSATVRFAVGEDGSIGQRRS